MMKKVEAPPPGLQLIRKWEVEGCRWLGRISWSPSGKRIAVGGSDRSIRVWDVSSGSLVRRLKAGPRSAVAFSWADDERLLTLGDGTIEIRPVDQVRPKLRIGNIPGELRDVACSNDGKMIAVASSQRVYLLDAANGDEIWSIEG